MSGETRKFETARTRALLASELDASDRKCVADIEEYGSHVLTVSASGAGKGWAYTVGIFDVFGKPELIAVGLKEKTGHIALNNARDLLGEGVDLTVGRYREIVGEVDVVFWPVDPVWVKELMGWTKWYQGNWDFPVLQLIYPDLENRFQWEEGFTEYFRQPLLQADAPQTDVEDDFKASADPESSFFDWKFPDPPHTNAYLSQTVFDGDEAVTYVSHDADDGAWQFLGDKMDEGGGPVLSCLHHPIDKDATLKELADLPLGWYAERGAVGEPWVRYEHDEEADEIDVTT